MQISVLSWNIHKGIGGLDRRYRLDRVIDVLAHHDADVLLLQEVDEGTVRTRFDRQIDVIGDALGLHQRLYQPTHKLRKGHYGNAILSRWPLSDTHTVDLTIAPKKKRIALCARIRVRLAGSSRSMMLVNLHLGLAGIERKLQLRRLFSSHPIVRVHRRTPMVLGGDFNDIWGTLEGKLLEPAGFRRVGSRKNSYPAVWPVRPLDGIFSRGDIQSLRCVTSRLKLAREASDHLPLVADFRIESKY